MRQTCDPSIRKFKEWRKALRHAAIAAQRAQAKADRKLAAAGTALLDAAVTRAEGARCHIERAKWLRMKHECNASMFGQNRYAPCDGVELILPDDVVVRYATMRDAASAADLLDQALKILDRGHPGIAVPLRQALSIVKKHPSHEDEQWQVERHLDLALTFLATPYEVSSNQAA